MNNVTQDLICICKQKTFSPVSSINSSQMDKALYLLKLPNQISSPSSYISGTACLIICEMSLFVMAANRTRRGSHFAHNFREFGVARSKELEVNEWIAVEILRSQSERAKNTGCLHMQTGRFTVWVNGSQSSGLVNLVPKSRLPFVQITSI